MPLKPPRGLDLSAYEKLLLGGLTVLVMLAIAWTQHPRWLPPPDFTISQRLPAPPEVVWPWLTDLAKRERWQFGIAALVEGRGPQGVPEATVLKTLAFDGQRLQGWERVTNARAPDYLETYFANPRAVSLTRYRLTETADGTTQLVMHRRVDYRRAVERYFDYAVARRDRARHAKALKRLAALLGPVTSTLP